MRKIFLCAITLLACEQVEAQQAACTTDRTGLITQLRDSYKESAVAKALTDSRQLLEILSSPNGMTWTILLTSPQGVTCIVASGTDFTFNLPALFGPEY